MKKSVYFLLFFTSYFSLMAQEFACEPDAEFAGYESFVSHPPFNPATGEGGIEMYPICIGEPFELVFSFRTGDSATIKGLTLDFINASIDTVGAIEGLPEGISYFCNPPDCIFPDTTTGCILLKGIATENNPIDTHYLKIFASVKLNAYGTVHTTIPGDLIDFQYNLVIKNTEACNTVSIEDPLENPVSLRNFPNPVFNQTTIEVTSLSQGQFLFQIFDIAGSQVHQASISLSKGHNSFIYDTTGLEAGIYVYSIGNEIGFSRQKMVVAKQ